MDSSSSEREAVVRIDNASVVYRETTALQLDQLTIYRGERVFVLGKSGSGKTTLARLLKGRLKPTEGTVRVLGCDPASLARSTRRSIQRRIAMIDQEFFLVPRLSVIGNVLNGSLGRVKGRNLFTNAFVVLKSLFGVYPTAEWEKAESILREVDLEGLGYRRIDTLSGGQRQRAAIARALMQDAEIILADEPVSNLDPELAEDALELLVQCTERRHVTLIVNLHQPRLARRFATRVLGLYQGKNVFDGPPSELSETGEEFIYLGEEEVARNETSDQSAHDPSSTTMAK